MTIDRKMTTESALKRISGLKHALMDLEAALKGEPFKWGYHDGKYKQSALERMDLHLCTREKLKGIGYEPKEDETPIGGRYIQEPFPRYVDLYLLETQAVKIKRK